MESWAGRNLRPEPAARLRLIFCNGKLQRFRLDTRQQSSRAASTALDRVESWAGQKHGYIGQSQQQGSNGSSATASCRDSILMLGRRYPEQISRAAATAMYGVESWAGRKHGYICQSQQQGSNGSSATASCRDFILILGTQVGRYLEEQQQPCMEWRAGQARTMAKASSK